MICQLLKTGKFESKEFLEALEKANSANKKFHLNTQEPSKTELEINEGYKFIAYSMDSVMLRK